MKDIAKKETSREYGLSGPWLNFFEPENFFPEMFKSARNSFPAVNVSEDNTNYVVEVVAPGFRKDDFKVSVEDDILTIRAETKQESKDEDKDKQYSRREYSYSAFTRSFRLPDNAKDDNISAGYEDGVLRLTIPKTTQQVKASKQVKID